ARARQGVEVRLLLDYSGASRMESRLVGMLKEAGCELHHFHPLRLSNIGVIDGRIGYLGGHGIAQQWTGDAEDREHWRDTFVRCEGPVVNTLQGVFCEN